MSALPRSTRRTGFTVRLGLILLAGVAGATALPLTAQQPATDLATAITFREIGPTAQGGRFVEFAVVDATPRIVYAASASGGLWKTENHGQTWASIFDDQPVISIGAVAVSQSTPSVLYVGTGEANNSRSSYSGDGIYKSTDAGQTWTNVGLKDSQHIGRIVVHPTDPNTAYVAALGHLYSHNAERGLYKTIDGGKTWIKALDIKVDGREVGAVDVAMDPKNPSVLYAATYEKVRRPWTFGEGGPGSGIYKTVDAGRTWIKLTGGLPDSILGRIGLSVSRQDPNVVYAIVENLANPQMTREEQIKRLAEGFGGTAEPEVYRSADAGRTWTRTYPAAAAGGAGGGGRGGPSVANPMYYYAQIRVDPNNKDHIYVLGVGVTHSTDGGKTWSSPFNFGGDNHALWINPADSNHMLLGFDHGLGVTFDAGRNWFSPDNMPLAQFYAVGYDMDHPYNVYGGIQDNGSWKGPSTMRSGGPIPFEAWTRVGGGDGMYNVVDWNDSRWLYNESQFGPLTRVDQRTGDNTGIRYNRPPGQPELRWNWSAPILVSPHDSNVIYHAANVLLRSGFRGEMWEEISPDLTLNAPERRNGTGNIQYATITTLDESPIVRGLILVGTDDGNVQITTNGGRTWTNLRDKLPGHQGYWISRVEASHHNPAVAYASATGYRNDDFRPFVWKTTDYGETWTSIAANLPSGAINAIREDHRNPNLLFVGAENYLYASLDGGQSWQSIKSNLPTTPVYDLQIHPRENELIVATHGRGIFIADITPLQGLTPEARNLDAALFDIQPTVQWVRGMSTATAALNFQGQSRPSGVAITYHLKSAVSGGAKVRVYDGARLLAEVDAPTSAGFNTVRWNMQASRAQTPAEMEAARGRGGRGGRGGGGFGGGRGGRGGNAAAVVFPSATPGSVLSEVPPGNYRVVLSVGGRELEKTATILKDEWVK